MFSLNEKFNFNELKDRIYTGYLQNRFNSYSEKYNKFEESLEYKPSRYFIEKDSSGRILKTLLERRQEILTENLDIRRYQESCNRLKNAFFRLTFSRFVVPTSRGFNTNFDEILKNLKQENKKRANECDRDDLHQYITLNKRISNVKALYIDKSEMCNSIIKECEPIFKKAIPVYNALKERFGENAPEMFGMEVLNYTEQKDLLFVEESKETTEAIQKDKELNVLESNKEDSINDMEK